jgi:enoyl-CoA hydratase
VQYIKLEHQDNISIVVIDRQEALNALNTQVLAELREAFSAIDTSEVRCVVISGAGSKAFVAGADIAEMSNMPEEEARTYAQTGHEVFLTIENFPVPVIAAVNGYALGGGCELSLACDLRLASDNAMFGQPETGLGITPGFGGTQRLPRIIGVTKAKELLYAGKRINAQEALACSLVNAVYPSDQLMGEAVKLAKKIAANAPVAVRAAKKAINDGLAVDMNEALAIETKLFAACFASQDQKNAMRAFVEKRPLDPFVNK